ncbi:MetQ/NlpA family ABC transporter substrate-binding protein [Cohnella candidum]|uniref:Lipoprotein n=1 Tax=Cohnella candidum TaxID=2674991 RepID=A0A3G3K4T4_9BACL|nr:MetQ/NlpA family ABC transporter substrate-binding protein [Cohnella candidum]AYQ75181.1 MetQ/NlpA family ABC transporter substrate-binding protein [Cohnella candidum]
MAKKSLLVLLVLVFTVIAAACGKSNDDKSGESSAAASSSASSSPNESASASPTGSEPAKLKLGVMAGAEEEIWKVAKEVAAKDNLDLELVVFNDYVQPNKVLEDGQLDANAFQHVPYLDEFNKTNGTHIVKLADTINYPIGVYSKSIKDLAELKDGDTLGLPNDPTNGARALILFQSAGLIKLKDGVGITATVRDIAENPKNLKFKELDAAFIPKALGDLTAAVINTNYAIDNGLSPSKDAIYREPKDSPWVNIIAVREGEQDKPVFQRLVKAFQSEEVKKFVTEKYGDSMVPAW